MGTVFAIKKYAIHDGPNIRTTVFLKGCPLRCWWCHNPEGVDGEISLTWNSDRCIGCGQCLAVCPQNGLSIENDVVKRNDVLCTKCLSCTAACPALAQETTGWQADAEEIIAEIKKDMPFYDESMGGVTFSGGEPLAQHHFLLELLRECGRLGIHRAVDTCCFAETDVVLQIADNCELFLVDLKHMNSDKHLLYTGVANDIILKNIVALAARGSALHIRIPLIGGVNNDEENIRASGEFIKGLESVERVDLLPYHSIAGAKYRKLGKEYRALEFASIEVEELDRCAQVLRQTGLNVHVGG